MQLVTQELVMERLNDVYDPEIRMSITELGLVYGVEIEDGVVRITYTLTTPACPLGPMIGAQILDAIGELPGVQQVEPILTFDPPWDPRTMASEDVKMALGVW